LRQRVRLDAWISAEVALSARRFAQKHQVPMSAILSWALEEYVGRHADDETRRLPITRRRRGPITQLERVAAEAEIRRQRRRGGRPLRQLLEPRDRVD
jgi:hypothetical protein